MVTGIPKNEFFRTSNFGLAIFLWYKGLELTNIEKADSQRKVFVFEDAPHCKRLAELFNFAPENDPELMGDVRKILSISKELKNKLYLEE